LQSSEIEHLKSRLRKYADYDEIKRELDIMKVSSAQMASTSLLISLLQYVEFAGGEDDAWLSDEELSDQPNGYDVYLPNPNADKDARGKSLEALLAAKNKRILEELTKFRVRRVRRPRQCLRLTS
jgi:homeobox protein cut-like